jgi:hypothetical protein
MDWDNGTAVNSRPNARRGRPWLAIFSVCWMLLSIYLQAALPGEREMLTTGLAVIAGGLAIVVCWLVRMYRGFVLRRGGNTYSWWVPVAAFAIAAYPPWGEWYARYRMSEAGPSLVAFLETQRTLPEGQRQSVKERIAGVRLISVTRFGEHFVLDMEHSPDSEHGLIYSGFATAPLQTRPSWVKVGAQWELGDGWSRYSWSDE